MCEFVIVQEDHPEDAESTEEEGEGTEKEISVGQKQQKQKS